MAMTIVLVSAATRQSAGPFMEENWFGLDEAPDEVSGQVGKRMGEGEVIESIRDWIPASLATGNDLQCSLGISPRLPVNKEVNDGKTCRASPRAADIEVERSTLKPCGMIAQITVSNA